MTATSKEAIKDLTMARSDYLFLVPPLLVFGLGAYLHDIFGNPVLSAETINLQSNQEALEKTRLLATGAVYRLIAVLFAFIIVAIATIAAFFSDLKRRMTRQIAIEVLVLFVVLFLPVFYYAILAQSSDRAPNYYYWGREIFEVLSKLITPGSCLLWEAGGAPEFRPSNTALCTQNAFLKHYVRLTYVGNSLSIFASLAVIMGMITSRAHFGSTSVRPTDAEAILKQYLYLGAIMLSVATAIYAAVGNLGSTVVAPELKDAYSDMANGLTVFWGIVFSAILAISYASVAFFSSRPAMANDSGDQSEAEPRRSIPEIIATLCAILSPILTGLLGSQIGLPL